MDNLFLEKLIYTLGLQINRLTLIKSSDLFFDKQEVKTELHNLGIELVSGSILELRVHFELNYKINNEQHYCYLINNREDLLEDIPKVGNYEVFQLCSYFPEYHSDIILKCSYKELCLLFSEKPTQTLSEPQTNEYLKKCNTADSTNKIKIKKHLLSYFKSLINTEDEIDWEHTFPILSEYVLSAIREEMWDDVKSEIEEINNRFQQHLELKYKAHIIPSSFVKKPLIVSKVLQYINFNFKQNDKVAVVVIDGMSYWQYLMLSSFLSKGIEISNDIIYSWIPSITQLSRQAIFKGDKPLSSYIQNPTNEANLWKSFWKDKGLLDAQIQYNYNSLNESDLCNIKRLAYVDVVLDDKMHASTDYNDLYDLTQNWIDNSGIIQNIQRLISEDFTVYLTTDHGNINARGLKTLTHIQTLGTNKSGSRSLRHLEYSDNWLKEKFMNEHIDWKPFLGEEESIVFIKNDCAFTTESKIITHGGSHMLEVLIPFIKLKKKTDE